MKREEVRDGIRKGYVYVNGWTAPQITIQLMPTISFGYCYSKNQFSFSFMCLHVGMYLRGLRDHRETIWK